MGIIVGQGPNVNASRLNDNQEETSIAIDPTNPQAVFVVSKTRHGTAPGMFDPLVNIPGVPMYHTPGLFVAYGNNTGGGTLMRIGGSNFIGARAVRFGGTPAASFTVDSANQIEATSPAHAAGAVDVTVTTPGGTSPTSPNDIFTYI